MLDLGLHDMSGLQLLERMRADKAMSQVPVIIYTGKELTKTEEAELRQLAQTIIIKDVKSPERLLDETTLFLHRVESALPPEKQRLLDQLHRSDPTLTGKKALVVDDDIRNIFALTSILERYEMDVQYAENGHDALQDAQREPRHRRRADGRHDAGNGRLRGDAAHPRQHDVRGPADHRHHGEGDEGRPREVHQRGRVRLRHQAG